MEYFSVCGMAAVVSGLTLFSGFGLGTGTISAVIVDVTRFILYGGSFYGDKFSTVPSGTSGLILAATLAAFAGAVLGARMMKKVTLRAVQFIVGGMLFPIGASLARGYLGTSG